MLTPPADLDSAALVSALAHWGLRDPRLEYLPVGFGSHHWRAEGAAGVRFVTVDDLAAGFQGGDDPDGAFAALERAYGSAAWLRDHGGLEFVLAPLADDDGVLLRRVARRYAVSVARFVDATSNSFGPWETKDERRRMAELLGRLHAAGELVPDGLPRRDDCSIASRPVLHEALAALDAPWRTGPFAEQARRLLAARAEELELRLREYDALADRVRRRSGSWVLTHGEPHRANVIVEPAGRVWLVDWDTTRIALRERDLWQVLDDDLTGWEEYARVAGDVSLDRDALELYRERWDLSDIALFVEVFRRPHGDDANTVATFGHLRSYLD